ncbi:MAG: ribosome maturation factor RimM [Candidatus Nitrotoga sp.]
MPQPKPDVQSTMLVMAQIIGAQGILGWVKLKTYTEYAESLTDYKTWWLGNPDNAGAENKLPHWREQVVEIFAVQNKGLIAKFPGCNDRTAAESYRGLLVAIPRNLLPPQPEGEFYWSDLIGLSVENMAGEYLGTVENLMDTGANQVLCVRMINKKEWLIPFIGSAIKQVSVADKKISVDWAVDWDKH